MQVTNRIKTNHGIDRLDCFTFDTGHEAHLWESGAIYVYTPKGNYATQQTMHKVLSAIHEFKQ
jgi:hypothetical protein